MKITFENLLSVIKKFLWVMVILSFLTWQTVIFLRNNHVPTGGDQYLIALWVLTISLCVLAILKAFSLMKKQNPLAKNKRKLNLKIGFNFILASWALTGIFATFLFTLMSFFFKKSEAFLFISEYIQRNEQIVEKTGDIYSYSTLFSGKFSSTEADVHFTVFAEKMNAKVHFKGEKTNNGWGIETLEGF